MVASAGERTVQLTNMGRSRSPKTCKPRKPIITCISGGSHCSGPSSMSVPLVAQRKACAAPQQLKVRWVPVPSGKLASNVTSHYYFFEHREGGTGLLKCSDC
eukprot:5349911-Amphidinium_carterae.1